MRGSLVTVGGRQYEVISDQIGRDRVFLIGSVVDDADAGPIARKVTLTSTEPLVFSARSEREIALAGNPHVALTDRSIPHSLTVTLEAESYRSVTQSITVPAFAELPHRHDFALRRLPQILSGRVYGLAAGPTPTYEPVPNATIGLSPIPASGGELPLLLRQPLRTAPGVGTTISMRSVAAQASLTAISDAHSGDVLIAVTDGSTVSAGQLLRIGPPARRFYAEVTQVIAHPDRPAPAALIQVTEDLVGTILTGATIDRFVLGAGAGPTGNIVGEAFAGEAVVWLDALPASGGVLMVSEPSQPNRYHDARALTGSAGDYFIEGVACIGEPTFEVSAAGFTTNSSTYRLDRLGVAPLDWYLKP